MVEYMPVILGFVLIFALIGFCLFTIRSLDNGVDTMKEKQLQAQLDAHSNEIQRLMHRCRALEDRLAEIEKWLPEETEEESALKKYLCKVQDAATRLVKDLGFKEGDQNGRTNQS